MTEGITAVAKKKGASGHGPGFMETHRKKNIGKRCDHMFPGAKRKIAIGVSTAMKRSCDLPFH
jgi:hypothetical protein